MTADKITKFLYPMKISKMKRISCGEVSWTAAQFLKLQIFM